MRPAEEVAAFVRDALAAGHSRAETAQALRTAGWAESEIAAGLEAWADTPFLPPVPRPRRHVSAAEAFSYGLAFVALGLTVGHLVALWFVLIDRWLPEPGALPWQGAGAMRWSMAVLVVAFPLFLWLDWRVVRNSAADPAARRSAVRRWFATAALFFAVLALVGNLIAVIYAFLSGELTLRFVMKALVVAAVAGAVLGYFRPLRAEAVPPRRPVALAALVAMVGLALLAGLWAAGGPMQGRAELRDRARLDDLWRLSDQLRCLAEEAGAVPEAVTASPACPLVQRRADPYTGAPYAFERISDVAFRVCGGFETDGAALMPWRTGGFDPSTGCLTVQLDRALPGPAADGQPPRP